MEKPETVAKAVLTKTYDATLKDYEDLVNVVEQSVENDGKLYEYLQIRYDDQLTDSGYNQFLSDRIPTIGAKIANEENSDIKVSSIELKSVAAVEGGKRYDFILQLQTEKDSSKTFTRKGNISLNQQNGEWKVDSLLPR